MTQWIAHVIVDLQTRSLDKIFDYTVPPEFTGSVRRGHRVSVSFGKQRVQAYVMGVSQSDDARELKPVLAVSDEHPVLTEEMLQLADWLRERTLCTHLDAIHAMLPAAFRSEQTVQYEAVDPCPDELGETAGQVWQALKKPMSIEQLMRRWGNEAALVLHQLEALGAVRRVVNLRDRVRVKTVMAAELTAERNVIIEWIETHRRSRKQTQLLQKVLEANQPTALLQHLGVRPSDAAVQALIERGLIRIVAMEEERQPPDLALLEKNATHSLTKPQELALLAIERAVDSGRARTLLLHGITGSGKTEVYLRAIGQALESGGGAIVLVPEIALTPQMVGRFVARFGSQVAVLHSGLSSGERRDEWQRIRRGDARIAIGARSAVFAPMEHVRLMIIDEEHEPSYKQEEAPRYEAREVARWRANYHGCTVVLGSATPSLQSMQDVERGHVEMFSMPFRVNGQPLPPVSVIDMREELRAGNRSLFSRELASGLEEVIGAGHQAILFLNRRGFASFMLCRNCGETLECPSCDISLTLHRGKRQEWLECHYCQHRAEVPQACPHCGEIALRPFGVGTQQVEQALRERWPQWRVLRMDVDTTRRKGAHRDAIEQFLNGGADVLLGTQMIAKGLDFPNVTFVGVVTADTMLAVPDYRSAERTFTLLMQVAGRAGRADASGKTVVQTFRPEHYAVRCAAMHDYVSFYRREIEQRREFMYPPFCELTVLIATHQQEGLAAGCTQRFVRELRRLLPANSAVVFPAVPAGIPRVEDKYRYQVVIKYSTWDDVRDGIAEAYRIVAEKMRKLGGTCALDVNAGRI